MRVLLLNLPFSALRPSLGVSLLRAHGDRIGADVRIQYRNIDFARSLGAEAYFRIAERLRPETLVGDWVFAGCLAPQSRAQVASYLTMVADRFPDEYDETLLADVRRARALAEPFLDEVMSSIDWAAWNCVGFTTTFAQNTASLALARRIKERYPELPIIFGGANCEDAMGRQLHLTFPFVDYVCVGEADQSFPALLQALGTGGDPGAVAGVVTRSTNGSPPARAATPMSDLDALPYPNFDEWFTQWEPNATLAWPDPEHHRTIPFETSRGCWWGEKQHCTFCGLNGLNMGFRRKSDARATEELQALVKRYPGGRLAAVDNILDHRAFESFLPALAEAKLGADIFYETKANLTRAQVQQLALAGITSIQPGIESLSTHVLQLMRKGSTALVNVQLLKWCREWGVYPLWNMLFGFPGETAEDYQAAADLMDHLHHLAPPAGGLNPIRFDRFSPYFTDPQTFGISPLVPDRAYSYVYPNLPLKAIQELAYYFEPTEGRSPKVDAAIVGPVRAALARWEAAYPNKGLVAEDDGETLAVADFRPGATKMISVFRGVERELYAYLEVRRSTRAVLLFAGQRGWDDEYTLARLQELSGHRLVVSADGAWLGLAVSTAPTSCVVAS